MAADYPPADALARAVLVRGIPHLADEAAVDEFFSFCGDIESKRMATVPPSSAGQSPTLEAVVVFADEASRRTALLMNESSILDKPVSITAVPDGFVIGASDAASPADRADASSASAAPFGGFFAGMGQLFSGVGSTVNAEVQKAATMLDEASQTGVLKTAKDQAVLARKKTAELVTQVDEQFHVQQRVGAVAGVVSEQTKTVASVVAEQSKSIATQVDSTLHISENTKMLHDKAMQNPTVNSGVQSMKSGFDSLLTTTGLQQQNGQQANATPQSTAPGQPASQTTSTDLPTSQTT